MPFEPTELRVSLRKLLAGLVLTIVPLSLAGLYMTNLSDKSLQESIGAQHKTLAQNVSSVVAQFISDRVTDCMMLAAEPAIGEAVSASDSAYKGTTEAAINERIDRVEKTWGAARTEPVVGAILSSPAARLLRRHRQIDPRFLFIVVADEQGVTVAASDKPSSYLQAKEPYWDAVYAQGRGATALRNASYDGATRSTYVGVAVPISDEASGRFKGAVYALVDISSLMQQLNSAGLGATSKTVLAKDDGTIIMAPEVNLSMGLKSEEYSAVRDALGTLPGRQTGYLIADLRRGGRNIAGFADVSLKPSVAGLGWIVIVSQDLKEATSPLRGVGRFALLMVFLGLLLLTLVAMYFFVHRKEDFEEIDVLHQQFPPRATSA